MKKAFLVSLICLMLVFGTFVGCNGHTHTFSDEWTSDETYHWHAATCEHTSEQGNKGEHQYDKDGNCLVCGRSKNHLHENLTRVPEVPATCTEAGTKEHYKCSCGKLFDKESGGNELEPSDLVIDPKGHEFDKHDAVKATCVGGNIEYYECKVCSKLYKDKDGTEEVTLDGTKLAPDESNHGKLNFVDATSGNCTTQGTREYYECELCGAKFDKENGGTKLDSVETGLNPDVHSGIIELKESDPTCTEPGYTLHYECSGCKHFFYDKEGKNPLPEEEVRIAPKGHDFTLQMPVPDGEEGHHRECSICGEAEKDENGDKIIYAHNVVGGNICIECGYKIHHEHELVFCDIVLPTCEESEDDPGVGIGISAHYECKICYKFFMDEYGVEEVEMNDLRIARRPHKYFNNHSETEHWMECSVCGHIDEDTHGQHKMQCGVCKGDTEKPGNFQDGCGYEKLHTEGDYIYGEVLEGESSFAPGWYICGWAGDASDKIVIPEAISVNGENKTVIGVFMQAFEKSNYAIEYIVIPESVKSIGYAAFAGLIVDTVYYEGTDWSTVEVDSSVTAISTGKNIYVYSESEPSAEDNGMYWHKVGEERVKYDRHQAPDDVPSLGVIYQEIAGSSEWAVSKVDSDIYFRDNSDATVIIQEKYLNGWPVTKINTGAFENKFGFVLKRLVIPTSVKNFDIMDFGFMKLGIFMLDAAQYVDNIFYEGNAEQWKNIENYDKTDVDESKIAFYSVGAPETDGLFWHWNEAHTEPVIWEKVSASGGAKLEYDSESESYKVSGLENDQVSHVDIPAEFDDGEHGKKAVTAIKFDAFNGAKLAYIIIPVSIESFDGTELGYEDVTGWTTFASCDATLFYLGDSNKWSEIANSDKVLKGRGEYGLDKHVWFFSSSTPQAKGRFWKYASESDRTPTVLTEYEGGKIPAEKTTNDNVVYVLSDDCEKYYIAGCTDGKNVYPVSEIDGTPVTEILANAFSCKNPTNYYGTEILIPASIEKFGENCFATNSWDSWYVRTIFYCGKSIDDYDKIDGSQNCGIKRDEIYLFTEEKDPGEGRYWNYNDGKPQKFGLAPDSTYVDDRGIIYDLYSTRGFANVVGYNYGKDSVVTIPETIKVDKTDYIVTAIADEAFIGASGIIGLKVGDNVKTIGNRAFYGINSLEWIVLGSGLTHIGQNAFFECDYSGIKSTAFRTFTEKKEGSLDKLWVWANIYFHGDKQLWEEKMAQSFFDGWYGEYGLNSQLVGGKCKIFYYSAVKPSVNAEGLWYYDGEKPMPYIPDYFVLEDILYEYDREKHTAVAKKALSENRTDYIIVGEFQFVGGKYNVVELADNIFNVTDGYCSEKVRLVVLPASITQIGKDAFKGQELLRAIVIGNVDMIENAFPTFDDINVYFRGSENDWKNNTILKNTFEGHTVYYYEDDKPSQNPSAYWHFADKKETLPEIYRNGELWTDIHSGIIYSYTDDGNATVVGYTVGNKEVLIIPSTISILKKEYKVVAIAAEAFYYCEKEFVGIIIPKSVTEIGARAFLGRSSVEYIVIHDGLTIGKNAFKDVFASKIKVYFDGTASAYETYIDSENSLTEQIKLCEKTDVYIYTDKVIETEYGQWHYDASGIPVILKEPLLPSKGEYVAENGVVYYYDITADVPYAHVVAYRGHDETVKIESYIAINDSMAKVTSVLSGAFAPGESGPSIKTIIFPETIETFGGEVFAGQTNIDKIVIGKSITDVTSNSFIKDKQFIYYYGMWEITKYSGTIYFEGSKEEWETIKALFEEKSTVTDQDYGTAGIDFDATRVCFYSDHNIDDEENKYWTYNDDKTKPLVWGEDI